jgi:hypothetical protein
MPVFWKLERLKTKYLTPLWLWSRRAKANVRKLRTGCTSRKILDGGISLARK